MYNNNTTVVDCQEELIDKTATGKIRPWRIYKLNNSYISEAYKTFDVNKARRLDDCATWLEFERTDNGMKLHNANFCRVRLCPICAWRRSLKTYGQVSAVVEKLGDNYAYVFLTLTCRNCSADELSDTITHLFKSLDLLMKYKACKQAFKGFFRGLEITHNMTDDTYHPHFHLLIAVNPSYFSSRYYLSQDKITALWKRALKASYTPIVDVRKIKGKKSKAIAEVAKYATKSSDIICFDDWDLTCDTVRVLDMALANRRLTGWSGVLKQAHKELHLDDNEDGDLIHTQDIDDKTEDEVQTIAYTWHTGYSQYMRI